ncbi:Cna B-type domain-containing protein [Ligilactobacillus animalis]|nr:Cna B-type domain-containing protein [Ligilactobacillus animalis]
MRRKMSVYLVLLAFIGAFFTTPLVAVADDIQSEQQATSVVTTKEQATQEQEVAQKATTSADNTARPETNTQVVQKEAVSEINPRAPTKVIADVKQLSLTADGKAVTKIDQYTDLTLKMGFTLPNNQVKEGDYSLIQLPAELRSVRNTDFEIKDTQGNVVAHAKIDAANKQIKMVYTDFVEKHSDITGTLTLALRVDTKVVKESKKLMLTLDVDGQVKPLGEIDYENRHDDSTEAFSKSTWFVDGKGKVIQYAIRVNGGKKDYQNVKIKDMLVSAGLKYKAGSFTIKKGDWKLTQTGNSSNGFFLANEVDVTSQYKVNVAADQRSFDIDLGDINGEGYLIVYQVEVGHDPVPGEAFSNKAQMTADNIEPIEYTANVVYQTSSGNATGYTYTLKVHKENQLGEPLSGAVFDVIRDSTGERVQTVTTGADGTAQITGLLRDNYTLVETKAPEGYQATDEQLKIKATEFVMGAPLLKHVVNKAKTIDISGKKTWEDKNNQDGKRPEKIVVNLIANGHKVQSKVVTAKDNWQYSFKNVPEYYLGKKINYAITEEPVKDYQTKVNGYDLINSYQPATTKFEVKKIWQDNNNYACVRPKSVQVQLYANGQIYGGKVELSAKNNWQYTWKDLPAKQNGKAIKYQVVEVTKIKGYLTHQVNTGENQVTLINRYCPPLNYPKHCHKPKVPKKDHHGKHHHGMNFFPGYIICY